MSPRTTAAGRAGWRNASSSCRLVVLAVGQLLVAAVRCWRGRPGSQLWPTPNDVAQACQACLRPPAASTSPIQAPLCRKRPLSRYPWGRPRDARPTQHLPLSAQVRRLPITPCPDLPPFDPTQVPRLYISPSWTLYFFSTAGPTSNLETQLPLRSFSRCSRQARCFDPSTRLRLPGCEKTARSFSHSRL